VTNQFGLTDVNYDSSYTSKYRKKKVNWVIPVVVLLFMGILGVVLVMAVPYLKDKLKEKDGDMAVVDGKGKPKDADQIDQTKDGKKAKGAGENKKKGDGAVSTSPFPRRALVVSIHNYLYANPTQYGLMVQGMKNIPAISKYLTNQMRVPANQIMHLSDAAKDNPTPPTKSVVESTITEFLKSSRKQDHLMLVFVGHAVENDGQVYLAPIEGDLTDPTSLIPLAWLYKELDTCAAHQKILVLDVCRFSPTIGIERPGGQPMSAKMEEVIKAVPAGLQVITACSAEQRSMETDGEPLGVFLDGFVDALQKGVQGQIQRQGDNIPIDKLFEATVKNVDALALRLQVLNLDCVADNIFDTCRLIIRLDHVFIKKLSVPRSRNLVYDKICRVNYQVNFFDHIGCSVLDKLRHLFQTTQGSQQFIIHRCLVNGEHLVFTLQFCTFQDL
jgi:hypothetical protein